MHPPASHPVRFANLTAALALGCLTASLTLPTVAQAPPAAGTQPAQPAMKDPVVTLLEPGAEPRQALRLKAKKGDTAAFEVLMNMKMSMSMGAGGQMPMVLPGMRMVTQMNVVDVKASGDMAYQFEYTDAGIVDTPGVNPMIANQMRGAIESIKGTRGSGVFTPRFFARDAEIEAAANADPMVKQQIEQMSQMMNQIMLPMPEEPVGVGGKWRVESDVESSGMKMKMVNDVTLREIAGDVITLDVAITQSADPQDIQNPQLPPNATLRLNSLKSSGTGTSTIDLSRPAPLRGEASMTSDADMTIAIPNAPQPQQMIQHMEITTTVKDVPAKAAGQTQPAGPGGP